MLALILGISGCLAFLLILTSRLDELASLRGDFWHGSRGDARNASRPVSPGKRSSGSSSVRRWTPSARSSRRRPGSSAAS